MGKRHGLYPLMALTLVGCMKAADTKKADDATAQFYQEVAAKQYQAIYDGAATDLRNTISSQDFVAMMQRIDANMGACGPPKKRLDIHINMNGQGVFRTQGYTRDCAHGPLNERVTIVLRGGAAQLAGYHFGADPSASGNQNN